MSDSKEIVTLGLNQTLHDRYVFEDGSHFTMISRSGYFNPEEVFSVKSNTRGNGMTVKVIPGDTKAEIDGTGGKYPGRSIPGNSDPSARTSHNVPSHWVVPLGVEVISPGSDYEPDQECYIQSIVDDTDGTRDLVGVYKFDIESDKELAVEMGVRSIPTIKAVSNGEVIATKTGILQEAQLDELKQTIL